MSHRFPKAVRLRKRQEFLQVQSAGRRVHGLFFLVVVNQGTGRIGITVSKKVGNAVQRNRVKRLVREFVRQSEWLPKGRDVVVIAKPSASGVRCLRDVRDDLSRLAPRLERC